MPNTRGRVVETEISSSLRGLFSSGAVTSSITSEGVSLGPVKVVVARILGAGTAFEAARSSSVAVRRQDDQRACRLFVLQIVRVPKIVMILD